MSCSQCYRPAQFSCSHCDELYCGEECAIVEANLLRRASDAENAYKYLAKQYSSVGRSAMDMTTVMRQHAQKVTSHFLSKKMKITYSDLDESAVVFSQAWAALFGSSDADLDRRTKIVSEYYRQELDSLTKIVDYGVSSTRDQEANFAASRKLWIDLGATMSTAISPSDRARYSTIFMESIYEVWKRYFRALMQMAVAIRSSKKRSSPSEAAYELAIDALVEANVVGTTMGNIFRGPKIDVSKAPPNTLEALKNNYSAAFQV